MWFKPSRQQTSRGWCKSSRRSPLRTRRPSGSRTSVFFFLQKKNIESSFFFKKKHPVFRRLAATQAVSEGRRGGGRSMSNDADVIIVGAGLAGLVAAAELADAGKRVIIVDQEPEQSLGGQAFWSFGGLFFVDSPEQRRMRIHDSYDLALEDWLGTAGFDRPEDHWPRKWAEAYLALRGWREARLALRAGPALLPGGRLGRARRLWRDRPRQLGAALPHHLGHRACRACAVCAAGARGGGPWPDQPEISPPRQ